MKYLLLIAFVMLIGIITNIRSQTTGISELARYTTPTDSYGGCIDFTPYVHGFNPDHGPHPTPDVIDQLLDNLVEQTNFRCIVTYGVLNGLNHTFAAAKTRGLKVISVLWISTDDNVNRQSIQYGIENAFRYQDTIIGLSCGSELRVRVGKGAAEPNIVDCVDQLRAAQVTQPLTYIDTWWGWVDETMDAKPCVPFPYCANAYRTWDLAEKLDWIGINVFPWWESKYGRDCYTESEAVTFHIEILKTIRELYPDKLVIMTEFGWPAGPSDFYQNSTAPNSAGAKICGTATEEHQNYVISETLTQLKNEGLPGIVFASHRERWKDGREGEIASFWGICDNLPPYTCKNVFEVSGEQSNVVGVETDTVRNPDASEPDGRTNSGSALIISKLAIVAFLCFVFL